MSLSAHKACALSQQTPMLAPEKGDVWSINNEQTFMQRLQSCIRILNQQQLIPETVTACTMNEVSAHCRFGAAGRPTREGRCRGTSTARTQGRSLGTFYGL